MYLSYGISISKYYLQNRAARPKLVYLWTVADVQKWFRRHCGDYNALYGDLFTQVKLLHNTNQSKPHLT